jgi:hypothetical protein
MRRVALQPRRTRSGSTSSDLLSFTSRGDSAKSETENMAGRWAIGITVGKPVLVERIVEAWHLIASCGGG